MLVIMFLISTMLTLLKLLSLLSLRFVLPLRVVQVDGHGQRHIHKRSHQFHGCSNQFLNNRVPTKTNSSARTCEGGGVSESAHMRVGQSGGQENDIVNEVYWS
jgi:hypothetical protein